MRTPHAPSLTRSRARCDGGGGKLLGEQPREGGTQRVERSSLREQLLEVGEKVLILQARRCERVGVLRELLGQDFRRLTAGKE